MAMRRIYAVVLLHMSCFLVHGGELTYDYYEETCPQVESLVREVLAPIFLTDPASPAAFLRLMFHDCQVKGCDGSILLDYVGSKVVTEMASGKNFGIRKRESIGIIKAIVEAECPRQVSCADIVVLAAREAVAASGGPQIQVPLGRKDSITTSYRLADASLPPPDIGVDGMLRMFARKSMTVEESVAILGAHTVGITHCINIVNKRGDPEGGEAAGEMSSKLTLRCPELIPTANLTFEPNDLTSLAFDNQYFRDTMSGRGLLKIDNDMTTDPRTSPIVERFAVDQNYFFEAFTSAFLKLSSSRVLTGNQGQVHESCNIVN